MIELNDNAVEYMRKYDHRDIILNIIKYTS